MNAALSSLRSSGGAGQVRAALKSAEFWSRLFDERGASYAEAVSAIEQSRSLLATLGYAVPQVVQARIDFSLAVVRLDWGDLVEADRLMSSSAPVLKESSDSMSRRKDVVATEAYLALYLGRHDAADTLLRERFELRRKLGQASEPWAAQDWTSVAINLGMQEKYDDAERFVETAPPFDAVNGQRAHGEYTTRLIPLTRARLRLESGDAIGALKLLPKPMTEKPDGDTLIGERALHGEVLCAAGRPAEGLPLLVDTAESISRFVGDNEPGLARLHAAAGLCALALGNRAQALKLAEVSRRAFTGQPGVSPYFKRPLMKLEHALRARSPAIRADNTAHGPHHQGFSA